MTVTSPKTKKQGKPKRLVPIFDELRPFLEESFELAEPGAVFVISQYRSPSGAYIRKRLDALVEQAGLVRWPRITHNLRASRQTELERDNPTHVVCAIMGNTPAVAHRHYLQTSVDDLINAAGRSTKKRRRIRRSTVPDWVVWARKPDFRSGTETRSNLRLCREIRHSTSVNERAEKTAQREWMGIEPNEHRNPRFLGKYSYHTDHSEKTERPNSPYV